MAAGREDGGEIERSRKDADDRDSVVVQRERSADDARVGGEAPHPQAVAQQYGFGAVPFAFIGAEEPSQLRRDAEEREEVSRHGDAAETLRFANAGEFVVADAVEGEVGGEIGVRFTLPAQIEEIVYLRGFTGKARGPVVGDPHEAAGIAEGQRADEESVDDAENGGAGADAEADDENGERGEAGVAAKGAEGVTKVLENAIEGGQAAGVAVQLFRRFDAAEREEGGAAGFGGSQAAPPVLFGEQFDVRGDFVVEFAVEIRLAEHRQQAAPKRAKPSSHLPAPFAAGWKKRPITVERRSQFSASALRRLRPFAVIE